jgi:hypothetical protein
MRAFFLGLALVASASTSAGAYTQQGSASLEVVVDQRRPTCPLKFETADGRELLGGSIRCGDSNARFTFAEARSRSGAVLYKERRGLIRCSVVTLLVSSFAARDRIAGTLVYKTNCLSGEKRALGFEALFRDGRWRFQHEGRQAHCLNLFSSSVGVRTMEWDTREECAR